MKIILLCAVSVAIISGCGVKERSEGVYPSSRQSQVDLDSDSVIPYFYQGPAYKRFLPLERGINFRDLGGYQTVNGGTVKLGQLFRSGHLAALSETDLHTVAGLKLKLVLDFRTEVEYNAEPDRLPAENPPRVVHLPIGGGERGTAAEELKLARDNGLLTEQKNHEIMNRMIALDFIPEYKAMFEHLSDPENHPALVHCAAGRDRAGWAAALILLALDVPVETVFEDYMATNLFYGPLAEHWAEIPYARIKAEQIQASGADPSKVFEKLRVRKSFLQPAFDAVIEKYGSVEVYLREGLGLSDDMRAHLKALLVNKTAIKD